MSIETILNRYDVQRRLGVGGMGDVWLASDLLLGRDVALKFVAQSELIQNPGALSILEDEAKTGGRLLGHPGVVAVLDLLTTTNSAINDGPALIMEYVKGCSVADWIHKQVPELDEQTRLQTGYFIGLSIVEAIHDAHEIGIIHRDIKPHNVLCSVDGRVKVSDFGLARVVEAITRSHTVWGRHTPLYSAPEQWEGERPTKKSDVYQLAATLYELFAGTPANTGSNFVELMRWHTSGSVVDVRTHTPGVDTEVADVIMAGLDKKPTNRPSGWRVFDALSKAVWPSVRFAIDATGLSSSIQQDIHKLTDFGAESLKTKPGLTVRFPNGMEALREAVGTVLLGGKPVLERAGGAESP